MIHPFAREILVTTHFRKISRWYLQKNGLVELKKILDQLQNSDLKFISGIRNTLTHFIDSFKLVEADILTGDPIKFDPKSFQQNMAKLIQSSRSELNTAIESYASHLRYSLRREMQNLNTDLENIDVDIKLRHTLKSTRYYRKLQSEISGFDERWNDLMKNSVNKIYLDLLIHSAQNQVTEHAERLKSTILQQTKMNLLNPLAALKKELEIRIRNSSKQDIAMITFQGLKHEISGSEENLSSDLHPIIENLPEEILILDYAPAEDKTRGREDNEPEILLIPVQRIVQHYLQSVFQAPVIASLQQLSNALKNQEYRIRDHFSLMAFEKENLDPEDEDYPVRLKEVYEKTLKGIREEEKGIQELTDTFANEMDKSIDEAFEPLASHRIAESSRNISNLIREYHGKQTVSKFGFLRENIQSYVKSKTVRLLYSQSEGILFAKRLSKEKDILPSAGQVAELVDLLAPKVDVLKKVPPYYTNLFSGRSSIGEDFWIDRKTEEEQFKKALDRYKRIRKGGIMVIGNRDSGKTALCKYLTRKHFNQDTVNHVYPPAQGSASLGEFEKTLQKVLGLNVPLPFIADSIGYNSVLVFHDLELWWER
ncbi:MAG: hypothetical protein ACK2TU_05495, partial [Anaerolineales bacterium]